MTAINRNSKPDSVFLAVDVNSPMTLATDKSQYRTNLTVTGQRAYELPSVRTGLVGAREISIVAYLFSTDNAVLLTHGDGSTTNCTYYVRVVGGNIVFGTNGTTVASVGLPAGYSEGPLLIHWSSRPEGASLRSEFYLYDFDNVASTFAIRTHTAPTTNAAWGLYVNGSHLVGGLSSASDIYSVRISERFHSTTEAYEDWVAETTPPAMSQVRRVGPLVLDRNTLDVAGDGSFMGPCHLWAGHSFEQSDRRLLGSLVNQRVLAPIAVTNGYDTPSTAWWRLAPNAADMHMCIAHLFCRPVPGKCNRVRTRVFLRLDNAGEPSVAEVRVRAYSLAGLPLLAAPVGPLTYRRTAEVTCATYHGSTAGAGEWLDLGALPLAVDDLGLTYFALAFAFDEESVHAASTEAYVHAITVEPYFEPADNQALDFGDL